MRKFYYHTRAYYDRHRITCGECGIELDDRLLAEVPCRTPRAYYDVLPARSVRYSPFGCGLCGGYHVNTGVR
ncbi:hypothetical protein V3F56_09070 [Moorellaceae bacterium AZ2]